jgi:hypothetical protein
MTTDITVSDWIASLYKDMSLHTREISTKKRYEQFYNNFQTNVQYEM